MNIFLDTSSLVKLYHREADTQVVENVFIQNKITRVFLSEISKIEFASTIWKKVRTKEIAENEAKTVIGLFESDYPKYAFIKADAAIIAQAGVFLSKYGVQGLRTLDSIQLSVAASLVNEANLFITADHLLKTLFTLELLPVL